jgi:hypothetical protein
MATSTPLPKWQEKGWWGSYWLWQICTWIGPQIGTPRHGPACGFSYTTPNQSIVFHFKVWQYWQISLHRFSHNSWNWQYFSLGPLKNVARRHTCGDPLLKKGHNLQNDFNQKVDFNEKILIPMLILFFKWWKLWLVTSKDNKLKLGLILWN